MIKINCLFLTFFVFNANLFPIVGYYIQKGVGTILSYPTFRSSHYLWHG